MTDLTNNPICLVLASLIADDIAELMDAQYDFEYAIERRLHYRKVHGGEFEPEYVQELYSRSNKRLNAVEKKLASIGINVQEAHNRLKAKQEAAA
jgi:hypothetical protein